MSTYDGYTEVRKKANLKYMSKFVTIKVFMLPEKRELVRAYAEAHGESLNSLINGLLDGLSPEIAAAGKAMRPSGQAPAEGSAGQEG